MSDDPMTAEGKTPEPNEGGLTSGEITPQPAENPTTAEEKAPQSAEENAPPAENAATSDEKTPQPAEKALVSGENTSQPAEKASVSGDKTPQLAEKALVSSEKTPTAAETPGAGHSGQTVSGEPTLSPDSLFWAPLNYGWVRELVYRNSLGPNNKKADAYYKSPAGKKYRSLKEIERAMAEGKPGFDGLRVENFTYNQYPLGVNDPSREVIRGADPTRQFPTTKRSFEAGETDSPAKKKPKTLLAKPKMSATPPSKTKKVTAPPKTFSRPTIVGPALTYSPLTTVSTPIRSYPQQTTIVGARAMGYGSGIRPVPTNLLMNPRRTLQNVPAKRFTVPPSPGKSAEEIVCEPAIYGMGKSPEKSTTSTRPQALQKATTRMYQIVSSKRLTVPFTVPPQDLALDGIATIAPSEDNTYVEGKTSHLGDSSGSDSERSNPDTPSESSTQHTPSVVAQDSSEPHKPEATPKRLDKAKLRKFLASKHKKFSSKPSSVSNQEGPSDSAQNASDSKAEVSVDETNNNSNSTRKRPHSGSDESDSESKPKDSSKNNVSSDLDHSASNSKPKTLPTKCKKAKYSDGSDSNSKPSSPDPVERIQLGSEEIDSESKPKDSPKNHVNSPDSDLSDSTLVPKPQLNKRRKSVQSGDSDYQPDSPTNSKQASDSDQSEPGSRYKKSPKAGKARRSSKGKKSRNKRKVKRKKAVDADDSDSESYYSDQSGSDSRSKMSSKLGNASDSDKSVGSKKKDTEGKNRNPSAGSTHSERSDSESRSSLVENQKPKLPKNQMGRQFIAESDQSSLDSRLIKPNDRKLKISSVYSSTSEQSGSDSEQNTAKTPKLSGASEQSSTNPNDRHIPQTTNPSPVSMEHSKNRSCSENETNEQDSPRRKSSSSSSISSSDSESSG